MRKITLEYDMDGTEEEVNKILDELNELEDEGGFDLHVEDGIVYPIQKKSLLLKIISNGLILGCLVGSGFYVGKSCKRLLTPEKNYTIMNGTLYEKMDTNGDGIEDLISIDKGEKTK